MRALLKEAASYVSYLCSVQFPFQSSMRGDLMKLCVITALFPDRRGDKFDPTPLIKSLFPRPLPPRSFELPKSNRECPTISQSAFLPAKTFFHQTVLHRPRRKDPHLHLLLGVSSQWLASASTGVSKVCASPHRTHGILNSISRAADMYVTRSKSTRISSSTDTTFYYLFPHKIHRRLTMQATGVASEVHQVCQQVSNNSKHERR